MWQAGYWSQQGTAWRWVNSHWAVPNAGVAPATATPTAPSQSQQPSTQPASAPEPPTDEDGVGETFRDPADAIGDVNGEAEEIRGSRQQTDSPYWLRRGFTEKRVYRDSNGEYKHVFYNPKSGEFSGGGDSSHVDPGCGIGESSDDEGILGEGTYESSYSS